MHDRYAIAAGPPGRERSCCLRYPAPHSPPPTPIHPYPPLSTPIHPHPPASTPIHPHPPPSTPARSVCGQVRLGKPSKPPKVARPADASLRAALVRAREDDTGGPKQTVGLGDSLAAATLGRGFVVTSGITHKARHEQFFECGTRLTLSADLHRKLEHPTEAPTVLPEALFRIREQQQYPEHYALLANRTETAIGFTSTMIPQRTGFGAAASLDHIDPAVLSSTLSLSPTKMQLQGSALGLAFDTLNYDLFLSSEVQQRLAVTPFTRMVLVFRYDDDDTLIALNDAVAKVRPSPCSLPPSLTLSLTHTSTTPW